MAQIERELKTNLVSALASISAGSNEGPERALAHAVMTVITERSDSNAFLIAWMFVVSRAKHVTMPK